MTRPRVCNKCVYTRGRSVAGGGGGGMTCGETVAGDRCARARGETTLTTAVNGREIHPHQNNTHPHLLVHVYIYIL